MRLQTLTSLLENYNLPLTRTSFKVELTSYIYDYHLVPKRQFCFQKLTQASNQ